MLEAMATATRFNNWMAETITPFVKGRVLEIGAGIGNLSLLLSRHAEHYIAADSDSTHVERLIARTRHLNNVSVKRCDMLQPADLRPFLHAMDTVVCLNVLEHIEEDVTALCNIRSCLNERGTAVILVPQGKRVFGTLDEVLEHRRRYSENELRDKMIAGGFRVKRILEFNRATYPGWFLNSRILRKRTLSTVQLRIFDVLVPLLRRIDSFLPWPPTSLVGIGEPEL
jgi:SAM-dependent methyltransferase